VQDKKVKSDLHRYLRDPGPGILIADEGHLLRNHNSNVSKAVAAVKTKRRIVLTGISIYYAGLVSLVCYACTRRSMFVSL